MAAGDLCELADVKSAAGITVTTWDTLITRWITAASTALRRWAGREFAAPAANPQTRIFDVGAWARDRELPIGDLAAAPTAVTVIDQDGVLVHTVTVATELVLLPLVREPADPIRTLRFRSTVPLAERYQVTVAGTWGFPSTPDDVAEACVEVVREWLRSTQALTRLGAEIDDQAGPVTRAIPLRAKALVGPYRTPVVA